MDVLRKLGMYVGYVWAFPMTLYGLFIALIGRTSFIKTIDNATFFVANPGGLVDFFFRKSGMGGITVGTVVFVAERWYADHAAVVNHEMTHVRQTMVLGVFFPLAYYGSSVFMAMIGKHIYEDNPFETQARRAEAKRKPLNIWE